MGGLLRETRQGSRWGPQVGEEREGVTGAGHQCVGWGRRERWRSGPPWTPRSGTSHTMPACSGCSWKLIFWGLFSWKSAMCATFSGFWCSQIQCWSLQSSSQCICILWCLLESESICLSFRCVWCQCLSSWALWVHICAVFSCVYQQSRCLVSSWSHIEQVELCLRLVLLVVIT